MAEKTDLDVAAGRRHIIERPRLTRLLDETSARVIMLVAPAGYGKTTLARQWLKDRPHTWYQATASASDVAALARTLGGTLDRVAPGSSSRLLERISAARDLEKELEVLADIQAEALNEWPPDAWLAIDSYELLSASAAADRYVQLLLDKSPVPLIVTSRTRPRWASARGLLYGDFYELGRSALSMNEEEAALVFGRSSKRQMPGLVERAKGWPAIIGLASLTEGHSPDEALPETLYDFFAEELYRGASAAQQRAFPLLALAPRLTSDLVCLLLGPRRGPRLMEDGRDLGFITKSGTEPELHPLLRAFLLRKLETTPAIRDEAARKLTLHLIGTTDWDAAFEVLALCPLPEVLLELLEVSLDPMMQAGRVGTVSDWLEAAEALGASSPIVDLARAELAVRQGDVDRAETLALRVARCKGAAPSLSSRAYRVAGTASHLDNRETDALLHFRSASEASSDANDRRDAVWGALLSAQAFETEAELHATLNEFLGYAPESADDLLRAASARLIVALTVGGVPEALEAALSTLGVLPDASDPLIRTSFLNATSRLLSYVGRYQEGERIADQEIEDATRSRLEFVLPHAHVAKAIAAIGLRRYGTAEVALTTAGRSARELGDEHNVLDVRTVRAKMLIATKEYRRAVELTRERPQHQVTSVMLAEHAATHGLGSACAELFDDARAAFSSAESLCALPEILSLISCGRAVISLKMEAETERILGELERVRETSILDPLVIACRACPELGALVKSLEDYAPFGSFVDLLDAERTPTPLSEGDGLSPREEEVLDLLALGYTNKEIARTLVIAEVTAKVHVRNILRKLNVRSRTEAALAAVRAEPSRLGVRRRGAP